MLAGRPGSIGGPCVARVVDDDDRVPLCTATFVRDIRFDARERTQLAIEVDDLKFRIDSGPIRGLRPG